MISVASTADAEQTCAIYNAAIAERGSTFETEPRSAEDFLERIAEDRYPFLIAKEDELVFGWAGLSPYSDRACYSGIGECSVYVAAGERGRGVGTALTEALATESAGNGFHKLTAKLFTDNRASIRLFARCGFEPVGTHRRHGQIDGEWRDVLVMERLLG
jgi:L-amino acid N-acyltransferase YncA